MVKRTYSHLPFPRCMWRNLTRFLSIIVFLIIVIPPIRVMGQNEYDEVSVFINVSRVGGGEISAVIKGEQLFLPVTDLFDFLKIRNIPSQKLEIITGFFINPDAPYIINRSENTIRYQDKTFNLESGDLIRTESNLYLKSTFFGKIFGLECSFNFRSLSVTVNSKLELPLIREMRLEEMRRNLTRLKGEVKADTTIERSHHFFKFGMADWSATADETIDGNADTRLNLALGSMLAGGEATATLNYSSQDPFSEKQQYYLWRYVNNDFKPIRQVMGGKIVTNSISSIYNPVVGFQITNTPTTYRRSFGSYTLSDKTEPGWIVELYVNNILVDYVKADASGFFTFEVPLVYGNSIVKLKFFGPWGEERTREQNVIVPFNFLPVKTLEYIAIAGIVEDSSFSKFSRAIINYGATKGLTLGGGVEYLSSVTSGPVIPFLDASLRITNNLLFSGEYAYGVRAKGTLTYRLPSNMQLDLNYVRYQKDQKAISFNYREERKAVVSIPLHIGNFSSYQRMSISQIVLPDSRYTTGEWLFSCSPGGVSTNLTTYALFTYKSVPNLYSDLSLAFRLPESFVVMPQFQYGYTQNRLISLKLRIEKHLLQHAYLNLSFEENYLNNLKMAELGFRYDFSFAQTGYSFRQSDKKSTFVQYARGSLIADVKNKILGADNRSNVGKGGISIIAYLDINANGTRDKGEPKVHGLNLHANGGLVERNDRDTSIMILGLEPYTNCYVELDPNSFDNISWKLPVKTLNVAVDPDIIKSIEIPVSVVGEATGNVILIKDGERMSQSRMIVDFYSGNLKLVGKTITEEDGYFTYLGLTPGDYSVRIDTIQLHKLGMISDPALIKFTVNKGLDGEVVDNLDFNLKMKPSDTSATAKQVLLQKPIVRKDTSFMTVHEITQELVTIAEDSYAIQLGAFKMKSNAEVLRKKLEKLIGKNVEIIDEDNFYKVRITELKDRKDVDEKIEILRQNGITEVWLISLKAKKQQWVVTEKQDTIARITERLIENPDTTVRSRLLTRPGVFPAGFFKLHLGVSSVLNNTVLDEMKTDVSIGKVEVTDIWIKPTPSKPIPEPESWRNRETPPGRIEYRPEIPSVGNHELSSRFMIMKNGSPEIHPVPTISLQIAKFYKRSQALRAQRKVHSKLELPVEVVQKWDFYYVIVRGFKTREETYKYYPELAGMGYPSISLIDKK